MRCFACDQPLLEGAEFCSRCGARRLEPVRDPLIGSLVGDRYRIRALIGEGGMGAVYEAEQRMGSALRKVAVKVLLPELSRDVTLRRRFHAECAIIAQLEHPHTVDVYDFGETETGQLYVVMEFLGGKSLGSTPQPLAVDRAVRIIGQVCGALHEAHLLGIVHRDLKPDNVLLTRRAGDEDFVKLLDFGIALHTGAPNKTRLTAAGTILGTPPYMSPEQLEGRALDPRSDVYSLGVIAYELLTGRLPFAASNPWEWAQRHRFDAPLPFDATEGGRDVPAPLRAVVLAALAKRPEDRPQSAREFASRLEAVAASLPPSSRRRPDAVARQQDWASPDPRERTEAALAAPVAAAVGARSAWVGVGIVVPFVALCLSVAAVTGAWVWTLDEPRNDGDVVAAPPPLTVLHPDVAPPASSSSIASASASPAASSPEVASSSAPALPRVAASTTRVPKRPSTSGTTGRRPPRPIR